MAKKKNKTNRRVLTRNIIIICFSVIALLLTVFLSSKNKSITSVSDREKMGIENQNSRENMDPGSDTDASEVASTEATTKFMNDDEIVLPGDKTKEEGSTEKDDKTDKGSDSEADKILADMSLEQKVYQMFMVTPETLTGVSVATVAGDATKQALTEKPVGGILYMGRSLINAEQTKEMLSNTQKFAKEVEGLPLFLSVDEEGGKVARIANTGEFGIDNVGPMKDIKDKDEAYKAGDTIGTYLKELGFNVDLAPVADVLTNPNSTIIGDRSFGDDPKKVTEFAGAYSDGLHSHGILSVYKHFPGHGAVSGDTHNGYADVDKTYDDLKKSELIPYMSANEKGVEFIMVAHISLPSVTGDKKPCSLSKKVVTDILRNDLEYEGIIITDSMVMKAITNEYSAGDAAVLAVQAGNDMILDPPDVKAAADGVIQAVKDGKISEDRIDDSVRRIIEAKLKLKN